MTSLGLIKYGIGKDYLPDWGYREALREIYQNFIDYGDYEEEVSPATDENCWVKLSNDYMPTDSEFMKIGASIKRNNKQTVGKHGEGLKMASLVLARMKYSIVIEFNSTMLIGTFYRDPFLGNCFGFEAHRMDIPKKFSVTFNINRNVFDKYKRISENAKKVLHSAYYGDLLDRPAGEVYVGGHFVATVDNLKYAYNFKPEHVELDRDRKVPKSFDVEYAASKILESWDGMQVADINKRDATYLNRVPPKVAQKFKPKLSGKGKVKFFAGKVEAPSAITKSLMNMPINQKRVQKLRFTLSKKRTPHSLVKEFVDTHTRSLAPEAKVDIKILLKKAENWRSK
jgi:hypothetical protein